MKTIRWIFGFPLAMIISLGIFGLAITFGMTANMAFRSFYFITYLLRLVVILFSFATWVFLTCFFIPSYKKIAGFVPIVLSIALACVNLYIEFSHYSNMRFSQYEFTNMAFMLAGTFIGYFVSYLIFKDKGWSKHKQNPRTAESFV